MSTPTNKITPAKNIRTAYLLWLPPLGWFGAHRFYFGQRRIGVLMSGMSILGMWLIVIVLVSDPLGQSFIYALLRFIYPLLFGILILTGTAGWWIADGFLVRGIVKSRDAKSFIGLPNEPTTLRRKNTNRKARNLATTYLLWLPPLGLIGVHRFYLGEYLSGVVMLGIFSISLLLVLAPLFVTALPYIAWTAFWGGLIGISYPYPFIALGAIGIWWVADGYWMRGIVKNCNAGLPADSLGKPPVSR